MIRIVTEFWGYPDGKKRLFKLDEEPAHLSAEYVEMLVSKGLAIRVQSENKAVTEKKGRQPSTASETELVTASAL